MLARRRAMSPAEVQAASQQAQQRLLDLPQYRQARSLALYAPIHGEVTTEQLCTQALIDGKAILFPAVCHHELRFRQVASVAELVPGAFGIREPRRDMAQWEPAAIDLIIVPGVAFDCQGRRVGYGKGYYDRALHELEGSGRLIGLCYDFQLVAEIIEVQHDVRLDLVVTEHRVLSPCD